MVIPTSADPLVITCARVLAAGGIELRVPRGGLGGREGTAAVSALAASSGVYSRRVTLTGRWWRVQTARSSASDPTAGRWRCSPMADAWMRC